MAVPGKGTMDTLRELWALVVSYARQETVDPLKKLGKSLGWGIAGTALISLATLLLGLSVLRLLQDETGLFGANLSWLPYLVVALVMVVVAALAVWGITRTTRTTPPKAPTSPAEEYRP